MQPSDFPASLAARVRELAGTRPDDPAYWIEDRVLTWRGYDEASDRLARVFLARQLDVEGIAAWVGKGAQLSDTVRTLMRRARRRGAAAAGAS